MKLCKFSLACKFYRANPSGASIPAPIVVPGLACKFYRANPYGASMPAPTVITDTNTISVGDIRVPFNTGTSSNNEVLLEKGNIVIDSGSTVTSLPADFYASFEAEMKKAITVDPVIDPNTSLRICYPGDSDQSSVPTITAHFTDADIVLNPLNLFKLNGDNDELFACLAFLPTDDVAIYGNIVQNNFIVEYDLVNKLVSFMSTTDCRMP
ncbi:probable aspartic protease At2g35615 [Papaver somniferum]|uniref:probable aspartic protease At2g35615 n=1 Tax=Papaver somniferum TaxID=3469 RepID=UPI000E7002DB|nr:probable aspartic protease At2g35615 [Papaver somniferum]